MSVENPVTMTITGYANVRAAMANNDLSRSIDFERFEKGNIKEDTLSVLHGDEHRHRRRVENRLFRREMFESYERELFPDIVEHTLDHFVNFDDADVMEIGGLFTVVLAARTAGVDFDRDSLADRQRLRGLLHEFALGSAADTAFGDIDEIKAEMREALAALRREYLDASWARRAELVRRVEAGEIGEEELPFDALTTLLRHRDELDMDDDLVARETTLFFTAGAHTSTQTITNTIHHSFEWAKEHPEDWERLKDDLGFVQRCVHEALRFRPTNPVIQRRALTDTTVGDIAIPEGAILTLDTISANHDPEAFGPDAAQYNPYRTLPEGVSSWGLSFGHGMHLCIGRSLAVGLPQPPDGQLRDDHLMGLVPIAVQALVRHGVAPHPSLQPQADTKTRRWTRWASYPVVFDTDRARLSVH